MKVKDLTPAPYNPRKISDQQLKMLDKSMKEFGDLSGIIVNVTTGHIIGGHQRVKLFDPSWEIVKKPAKDKVGTIAEGHIVTPRGNWTYREVKWTEKKEYAANIAANKHGGEFDLPVLKEIILDHLDGEKCDGELIGFDEIELSQLLSPGLDDGGGDPGPGTSTKEKKVECPECGHEFTI